MGKMEKTVRSSGCHITVIIYTLEDMLRPKVDYNSICFNLLVTNCKDQAATIAK